MLNELVGVPGELRGVVTITRKETGAVETYSLVGRVSAGQPDAPQASAHGDESSKQGD